MQEESSTMTTQKHKILILTTPRLELADHIAQFEEFKQHFDIFIEETSTKEDLIEKLVSKYNDISGIWVTGAAIWKFGGPGVFVDYYPSSLKIIAYPWVGYIQEDVDKLKEKGIIYCNVGDVSSNDVADIALHLTLSAYRFTSYFEHQLRRDLTIMPARAVWGSQEFDKKTGEPLLPPPNTNIAKNLSLGGKKIESPSGKIAGIVGLGSIGAAIGKRLSAIGMEIRYTKRKPLTQEEEDVLGYKAKFYPTFEDLIKNVDLIVFAVPATPSTKHLINPETIKLVKPGVRLVNIGRGSAIDENVLFKALDDGTITSVGLDVFEGEPYVDKRYQNRWDVTITPHIGNGSTDNLVDSNIRCMKNIINVLIEGGQGISPIL